MAHNENATIIEPLHCTLTSRVCLASQYAYLQSAANEGRTFTQILEENAFEPGDDHENVFENAETEVHDQHVLAEITDAIKPGDNKQEEDAGSESQDGAPKPEYLDTEADSAEGDHSQTLEQQQQQIPGHGLDVTGRLVKEAETRGDEEHSASTAKGDSHDLEGDYDLSPELCFKPDACLCPSCTNIKPDSHARLSSQHEYVTHPEDPLDETVQNTEDPEQVHPDGLADTNDGDEPDFESNIHDSASSRTLEAENNELEEDPNASYDHDQQSDNGYGEFDIQYDDGEEFELEEGVHQDATAETKDGEAVDAHPRHDHEELDLEHTVPSLGGDLVDNNGVNSRSHQGTKPNEGSHDVTQPEDDDDLLNFDDGDAENGEEEQDQNAAFANHPTEVPSSENNNKDATKARQNGASHWENDSSLGALGPNRAESPVRKSISNMSTMPAEDAPSTPSGGKNGSKRKVFEDDEEFDLLDTATPEKKRRRPSP